MLRKTHFAADPQRYQHLVAALLPYESFLESSSGIIPIDQLRIVISQAFISTGKTTLTSKKERSISNFIRDQKAVILEDIKRLKGNATGVIHKSIKNRQNYFMKCARALGQLEEILKQGKVTLEMAELIHRAVTSTKSKPSKKILDKYRNFIRNHRKEILDNMNNLQSSQSPTTSIISTHSPDPSDSESCQNSPGPLISTRTTDSPNSPAESDHSQSFLTPSTAIKTADLPNEPAFSGSLILETTANPPAISAGSDSIENSPGSSMSILIISPDASPRFNRNRNSLSPSMEMMKKDLQNSPNASRRVPDLSIRITTDNSSEVPFESDCNQNSHSQSIVMTRTDSSNAPAGSELNRSSWGSSLPISTIDSLDTAADSVTDSEFPGPSMSMKTTNPPDIPAESNHRKNLPSPSMTIKRMDSPSASADSNVNQSPLTPPMPIIEIDNSPNAPNSPELLPLIKTTNSPHAPVNFDLNRSSPSRLISKRPLNSPDPPDDDPHPRKKRKTSLCRIF